jgi:nucleotide-binding universal stress UspA family protein
VIDLSWCRHPDVARPHEMTLANAHLLRTIEELGAAARPLVAEGDAAAKIVETARRERADLIAMTTHGRSGVTLSYYGSVAAEVMRNSPCPVLVCRDAPPVTSPTGRGTRR